MKGKHKKHVPQKVVDQDYIEEEVTETVDEVEAEDAEEVEEEDDMKRKTNQKQETKNPKNEVNTKAKGKKEEDDEEDEEEEGMPLWKKVVIGAGIALLAGGGIAFGVHQAKKGKKKHHDYSDDYLCIDADDRPLLPNRPDYRGASEEPDIVVRVTD